MFNGKNIERIKVIWDKIWTLVFIHESAIMRLDVAENMLQFVRIWEERCVVADKMK